MELRHISKSNTAWTVGCDHLHLRYEVEGSWEKLQYFLLE